MSKYTGCDGCKYVEKSVNEYPCNTCIHGIKQTDNYVPNTHADRIRNMTDEELAIFINSARCDALYGSECEQPYCEGMCGNSCNTEKHIDKHLLKWLQAEVEDE